MTWQRKCFRSQFSHSPHLALSRQVDVVCSLKFLISYRTWISEKTNFKREVAEISLAHGNKDRVEAAYARAEFREQRRQLSDAWGAFCSMPSSRPSGDVIDFKRGA